MDGLISALASAGGGGLAAAVELVLMGMGVRAAQSLLKREWDRNDRLSSQVDMLVRHSEKSAGMLESLKRDTSDLLDRGRREYR
jgi:hypothetical protein